MTWNYRVIRKHGRGPDVVWFDIHEVYYDSVGKPEMCSEDPIAPCGETPAELTRELERMREACEKPILDFTIFEPKKNKNKR